MNELVNSLKIRLRFVYQTSWAEKFVYEFVYVRKNYYHVRLLEVYLDKLVKVHQKFTKVRLLVRLTVIAGSFNGNCKSSFTIRRLREVVIFFTRFVLTNT